MTALVQTLLAGLIFISFTAVATTKVHKWTDENGVTHYSEMPPENTAAKVITLRGVSGPAKTASTSTTESADAADPAENTDDSSATKLAEETKAIRQKNCAIAKSNLTTLENTGRIREKDPETGDYRFLPEEEKLAQIAKMRDYIRLNCSNT